jgi:hypothetical protein
MEKKTDLVFEYFENKYGFDIQKLGIDKYQIQHIFQNNHRYFDKKDSIKILILHIEKMIDTQIKDNKKKIISNSFLEKETKKEPPKPKVVEEFKEKDKRLLLIDSKDRDFLKYKFPSYFSFNLKKSIKKEILIKEVILRSTSKEKDSSDNLDSLPYLILDLGIGNQSGSNNFLKSASAILTNYETRGDYRYYKLDSKIYLNSTLTKLEIKIRKPDGDVYNFGSINNDYINTVVFINLEVF